jgi:hypothetical protein
MSEYFFGLGPGWLPKRADKIARKFDAYLVNYTDAQCNCGYGCRPYTCKQSRRHWFACQNLGAPFDKNTADAVLAALSKTGIGE